MGMPGIDSFDVIFNTLHSTVIAETVTICSLVLSSSPRGLTVLSSSPPSTFPWSRTSLYQAKLQIYIVINAEAGKGCLDLTEVDVSQQDFICKTV